jgi:hypothetical protein
MQDLRMTSSHEVPCCLRDAYRRHRISCFILGQLRGQDNIAFPGASAGPACPGRTIQGIRKALGGGSFRWKSVQAKENGRVAHANLKGLSRPKSGRQCS